VLLPPAFIIMMISDVLLGQPAGTFWA